MKKIMLGTLGFVFSIMAFSGFNGSPQEMKNTSKDVTRYASNHGDAW